MHRLTLATFSISLIAACSGSAGPIGPGGPAGASGGAGKDGTNGASGGAGKDGANGANGVDGQLRIYGDGSAGALDITANTDWDSTPPMSGNLQFTTCAVTQGIKFTVPSGLVLRCQATVQIDGTIEIATYARGGVGSANGNVTSYQPAQPGWSAQACGPAQFGPNTGTLAGGKGGVALGPFQARFLLDPGVLGGGGGCGRYDGSSGGQGGGALTILAADAITVGASGVIIADGQDRSVGPGGVGGGGGGVAILASKKGVTNQGVIHANGGAGSDASFVAPACGGGGGGIVHLLAPMISAGTVNVDGGAAGSNASTVSSTPRAAGGGGGASGGAGGKGSNLGTGTVAGTGAADGAAGQILESQLDPTALF